MNDQAEMTIEELGALFSEMDDASLILFLKTAYSVITERGIPVAVGPQGVVFFDEEGNCE